MTTRLATQTANGTTLSFRNRATNLVYREIGRFLDMIMTPILGQGQNK
ncbi:hypothetical protein [Aquisphaera giovannonii]|nr:hypothetical protein [Aquisphaera giovannonii]